MKIGTNDSLRLPALRATRWEFMPANYKCKRLFHVTVKLAATARHVKVSVMSRLSSGYDLTVRNSTPKFKQIWFKVDQSVV